VSRTRAVERHLKIQFGITNKDLAKNEYYLNDVEWLCIPEQKLLELTRGKIYEDPIGEITKVRKNFSYYNEDIWKYKMLYCWGELSDFSLIYKLVVNDGNHRLEAMKREGFEECWVVIWNTDYQDKVEDFK
jgi:hypothetical protein